MLSLKQISTVSKKKRRSNIFRIISSRDQIVRYRKQSGNEESDKHVEWKIKDENNGNIHMIEHLKTKT